MLTERQMTVANLVSEGKTNKEIASELNLTEGTVKIYLQRLFLKMGIKNRTDLAMRFERGEFLIPNSEEELTLA